MVFILVVVMLNRQRRRKRRFWSFCLRRSRGRWKSAYKWVHSVQTYIVQVSTLHIPTWEAMALYIMNELKTFENNGSGSWLHVQGPESVPCSEWVSRGEDKAFNTSVVYLRIAKTVKGNSANTSFSVLRIGKRDGSFWTEQTPEVFGAIKVCVRRGH